MRKHVSLKYKGLKYERYTIELKDNAYVGYNGIYAKLDTTVKIEQLISTLSSLVYGICYKYITPTSIAQDDKAVCTDVSNNSEFCTMKISFDNGQVARITVPNGIRTKRDELKALFMGLDYFDFNDQKLTVKTVEMA